MAIVIVMPRLSPTMEEGVLARWSKQEGDSLAPGDIIAEVETDKANMDFPLEEEGVILKQLVRAGDTVKLGAPVAIIGDKGEDISALLAEISGAQPAAGQGGEAPAAGAAASDKPAAAAKPAAARPAPGGSGKPAAGAAAGDKPAAGAAGAADKAAAAKPAPGGSGKPDGAADKSAAPSGGDEPVRLAEGADEAPVAAAGSAAEMGESEVRAKPQTAGAPAKGAASAAPATQGEGAPERAASRLLASPLARRLATDAGVDIRQVKGSGPGGRIVKRDIEQAQGQAQAQEAAPPAAAPPAPAAAPPAAAPQGDVVPLSMMRKTIARRLTEAKQTVPHFYLTAEAGVDELWRFREGLNAQLQQAAAAGEVAPKISVNDLVLKATARALRVVPEANMSFSEAGMVRHPRVDLGVAVSLPEGLITPVVRGAEHKSIGAIAAEVRDMAERARQRKLRPEEYQGATFSVSNLGMYGIREFFAIINPPESGILAVGKVEKRPVVVERGGEDIVTVQRRMTLTLSCDHRVIDGALGARLLAEVVKALEHPLLLVM